ncbi:hypothetical protein Halru_0497 [Halovivax ruber XH-70]|uniref:Uncharacterized protein n=1 Tax=Halovivax ruber (strain DSM 18193 / JCM 13892 / XH-70) TaxID=797302 RepID=L0IB00_HALRX|nr:hypothetical protein [Halovivax ruber]AGB15132.1 hypothetical protein Halru_0497 [Halovivax ruber XH-70]
MDATEETATDGGAAPGIDQEVLYATVYAATREAMLGTVATVVYLVLAAFFVFGGVDLAISNSGTGSIVWGSWVSMVGVVIAAEATGVTSLSSRFR